MSFNKLLNRHKSRRGGDEAKSKKENILPGDHLHGFFTNPEDLLALAKEDSSSQKKQQQKVKEVKARVQKQFPGEYTDEDCLFALRLPFANGNIDKAVKLLALVQQAYEHQVKTIDSRIKEIGAVNRTGVSCYLDSVLFAMFAQLDSFDSMLDEKFKDPKKAHLAALLRLWVNAERSGELITTDITEEITKALAKCGWKDAGEKRQQDALEAFSFILEQLGFPDLHLKMDIFHSGKEDKNDDHKIIRERVLAMPLPEPRKDGVPIKLEDCFELALTARIDVRRRHEEERRATISSVRSQLSIDFKKSGAVHVESVELAGSEPATPVTEILRSPTTTQGSKDGLPSYNSHGFIQERYVDLKDEKELVSETHDSKQSAKPKYRRRASTLRKEVLMPAWQMYSLIPFHTDEEPKSDEEVIEHLRKNRPTFCIALKRYSYSSNGQAVRRSDQVDIPLDMALPYFIYDSCSKDNNILFQNFKIALQSLVCHRGKHVEAGHYVSLVRSAASTDGSEPKWLLHDDMAEHRVREVDIHEALKSEMPYLLFYRVEPIEPDVPSPQASKPPSLNSEARDSGIGGLAPSVLSDAVDSASDGRPSLARQSSGLTADSEPLARGRASTSRERPTSIALTDVSIWSDKSGVSADAPGERLVAVLRKSSQLAERRYVGARAASSDGEKLPGPEGARLGDAEGVGGSSSRSGIKRHSSSLNRLSGLFSKHDVEAALQVQVPANPSPAAAVAGIPSPVPEHKSTLAPNHGNTRKLEKERDRDKEKGKGRMASRGRLQSSRRGEARPERECLIM